MIENLTTTFRLMLKTLPLLIVRMGITLIFGFLWCVYLFSVYSLGNILSSISPNAPVITWIIGLLASYPLARLVQEYVLYLVKAAHIGLIAHFLKNPSIPDGESYFSLGKTMVTDHFKTSSALFVVDRMIHGVIRSINGLLLGFTSFLNHIPGGQGLQKVTTTILRLSLTYIDEAILARKFYHPEENVWDSARKGIILYAQSWRAIFGGALLSGIIVLICLPFFMIFTIGPALALLTSFPTHQVLLVALGIAAAFILKAALIDPLTMTFMIVTYLRAIEGQEPNPEWEQKLSQFSKKFRQLQEKATAPTLKEPAL